jgi:hypothetical protein
MTLVTMVSFFLTLINTRYSFHIDFYYSDCVEK